MPISRYPLWRDRGSQLLAGDCLPDEVACVTADGRTFSPSEIVDLILAGRDPWNAFRASLPPIQWYRGPCWLPGLCFDSTVPTFVGEICPHMILQDVIFTGVTLVELHSSMQILRVWDPTDLSRNPQILSPATYVVVYSPV